MESSFEASLKNFSATEALSFETEDESLLKEIQDSDGELSPDAINFVARESIKNLLFELQTRFDFQEPSTVALMTIAHASHMVPAKIGWRVLPGI